MLLRAHRRACVCLAGAKAFETVVKNWPGSYCRRSRLRLQRRFLQRDPLLPSRRCGNKSFWLQTTQPCRLGRLRSRLFFDKVFHAPMKALSIVLRISFFVALGLSASGFTDCYKPVTNS